MAVETILMIAVLFAGFYMAWNIGANDVANAMGTSVGSGALTLQQAVFLAAILEFTGAFFFGSHVSDTIQKGIVDPSIFNANPLILVYGMLSALLAAGVWLNVASYFGWPVSTTHSIVGALIGFGAIVGGIDAVKWSNVGYIFSSWILSPLLGGIISWSLFSFLRNKIFYSKAPLEAAKKITPLLVFLVIFTMVWILLFRGFSSNGFELYFISSFCIAGAIGCLAAFFSHVLVREVVNPLPVAVGLHHVQLQEGIKTEYAAVEKIFGYLQIMTACLMAFAHGANDVANAIGPLAAALAVLTTHSIQSTAPIPLWILGLGGIGIVFGLATWGWRVIETIGKKITELTPTRGFAAEFGAATTVVIASRLGLPISTTHTLVGAVIGVGMARGLEALDLRMTRDIFISWLVTVPAGAFLSVALFFGLKAIFG